MLIIITRTNTYMLTPLLYYVMSQNSFLSSAWLLISQASRFIMHLKPTNHHRKEQRLGIWKERLKPTFLYLWRKKYLSVVTLWSRVKSKWFGWWDWGVKGWCLLIWIIWVTSLLVSSLCKHDLALVFISAISLCIYFHIILMTALN